MSKISVGLFDFVVERGVVRRFLRVLRTRLAWGLAR